MPKPTEYKYIRAWGNFLGSREYYIKQEQASASIANAPIDALYARVSYSEREATGEWATFSGLKPTLQEKIQALVDKNDAALGKKK